MKDGNDSTSNSDTSGEALVAERPSFFDGPLPDAHLFDPADYADELAECDISPDQASKALALVWRFMSMMVDSGIGVGSVHNLLPGLFGISGEDVAVAVDSDLDRLIEEFRQATAEREAVEEGSEQ